MNNEVLKKDLKKVPVIRTLLQYIKKHIFKESNSFPGSKKYWNNRYKAGGNSGSGSYNELSEFKAEVINHFVENCNIKTVIEFGCGDGNQLKLANYSTYKGFDVSSTAISLCRKIFKNDKSKLFKPMCQYKGERAQLLLSLDVIYHLVEDDIYDSYMRLLFNASEKYVIIYSSNTDENFSCDYPHVRHRKFTDWIDEFQSNWQLLNYIPNRYPLRGDNKKGSLSDFYIYGNTASLLSSDEYG